MQLPVFAVAGWVYLCAAPGFKCNHLEQLISDRATKEKQLRCGSSMHCMQGIFRASPVPVWIGSVFPFKSLEHGVLQSCLQTRFYVLMLQTPAVAVD